MNSLLRWTALLVVFIGLLTTGCRRVPPPIKPGPTGKPPPPADPFKAFLENTRYPDVPRPGDDWTRYRDNFESLTHYFATPDARSRIRLEPADRAFLENEVHLTEAEIADLDSSSFRPPDAHYLDECFLMHDVARTREVRGLSVTQQADMDFHWVMRNVMLHEQGDSWVPPAFTLRRGYGSAVERALVFLALLRQSRIEGCLVFVPDSAPWQFLVGAIDAKAGEMVLFDTRLGLALKSKDHKQALTLKQALADPTLLQPSKIKPDQAKTLEVWLACPLYALAPRLLEIETQLSRFEAITLHMNAKSLRNLAAATTTLPVKVWNPPAQGKAIANSPTRCLPLFLPRDEGGLDESRRAERWAQRRIPFENVEANLAQINVTRELVPKNVFYIFDGVAKYFFDKYDLQVRELYLRGRYETVINRQVRLQAFASTRDDDALAGLAQDEKFRKEVLEWEKKVNGAFAALGNPQLAGKAQEEIQKIAVPDEFMKWMLEGAMPVHAEHVDPRDIWVMHLDKERPLEKDAARERKEPKMMSKIQAVGMRDYFAHELVRSQALTGHERASRAQAGVAAAKPTKAALARTQDEWSVARDSWSYYLDQIALSETLEQRLGQFRYRLRQEEFDLFGFRVSLLESLHVDIHKYFQAKLSLAECKSHLEDTKKVRVYLAELKGEIKSLKEKGQLETTIKALGKFVQGWPQVWPPAARAHFGQRLDLLAHDWTDDGVYDWMLRAIDERLAALP